MERWIKEAMKGLTPEQDELARDFYMATFNATAAQLRSLLGEIATADLPDVTRDALAKVCRIGLGDHAHLAQ